MINPLVYPEGDTLLFRGGEILGREIDITLEATAAGLFNGLRVIVIVTAFGLMSAASTRRASADVPAGVVSLGAHRNARHPARPGAGARRGPDERRRALPPAPPGRLRWRAPRWPARSTGRWTWRRRSRYAATRWAGGRARPRGLVAARLARGRGGALLATVSVAGAVAGVGTVEPYPSLQVETGATEVALGALVLLVPLTPFAGRAARLGVARGCG